MFLEVGLVSLYTGCLCLDRRSVGQTMVSQPLVAVAGLGLIFNQLELSLAIGSILQLLWMGSSLYGANIPQNETLASTTAAGALFISMRYGFALNEAAWVLAVMITAPTAFGCKRAQEWLDRYSSTFSQRADVMVKSDKPASLSGLIFTSILASLLVHVFIALVVVSACIAVLYLLEDIQLIGWFESLGLLAWFVLPALALAVSLSLVRRRLHLTMFLVTFCVIVALFHSVRGGL